MSAAVEAPASRAHAAIRAFHETARAELGRRPEYKDRRPSATLVAQVLEVDRSHYAHCLAGHRGSFDTVVGWLDAWNLAGLPKLELVIEGAGPVRFRRVHR